MNLWSVKYHELIMCKPSYDLFIDDKNYGFSSNWKKYLKNKIMQDYGKDINFKK